MFREEYTLYVSMETPQVSIIIIRAQGAPHPPPITVPIGLDNLKGIESDFLFKARQIAESRETCTLWKEID